MLRVLCYMTFISGLIFGVVMAIGIVAVDYSFSVREYWSSICLSFFTGWWIVYFVADYDSKISKLTTFLEEYSVLFMSGFPEDLDDELVADMKESYEAKSISWITAQTLYIAVIAIFFLSVRQIDLSGPTLYQETMKDLAFVTGLVAMFLFVTSADIFDTVSNAFRRVERFQIPAHLVIKDHYYQQGSRLSYWGYATFLTFVLLSFTYFQPLASGLGAGVLAFAGMQYWYGNPRLEPDHENEKFVIHPDKPARLVGQILGFGFLAGTGIVYVLTR